MKRRIRGLFRSAAYDRATNGMGPVFYIVIEPNNLKTAKWFSSELCPLLEINWIVFKYGDYICAKSSAKLRISVWLPGY